MRKVLSRAAGYAVRAYSQHAQGPSNLKLVDKHVDYVFRSMLNVQHRAANGEKHLYAPKLKAGGEPYKFKFSFNELGQVTALCPNGSTYNLSRALANANLKYLRFGVTDDESKLYKRCLSRLGKKQVHITRSMRDFQRNSGSMYALHLLEIYAINRYTGLDYHSKMNDLLRGNAMRSSAVETYFILSMLAISGVNKLVCNQPNSRRGYIKRYEQRGLKQDLECSLSGSSVFLGGLNSFTTKPALPNREFTQRDTRLYIDAKLVAQQSIAAISQTNDEDETLLPPMNVEVCKKAFRADNTHHFFVRPVHGRATEGIDDYVVGCALQHLIKSLDKDSHSILLSEDDYEIINASINCFGSRLEPFDLTISKIMAIYISVAQMGGVQEPNAAFNTFLQNPLALRSECRDFYGKCFAAVLGKTGGDTMLSERTRKRMKLLVECTKKASIAYYGDMISLSLR